VIAMQYMFTGMFMALVGGFMAYVFRMQLAFPGINVPGFGMVSMGEYNALVTNHGTIMIFWVAMPVLLAAFGNYLIPLMVGADDMVFPKINRLSFQVFFVSTIVILASLVVEGGGFAGAWTAYPPLSANETYNLTPLGSTLWVIGVGLEFVAFLLGGINFITTLMNSRAPGMRAFDVPLVVWMIVVASILFMLSVGPLLAGAIMLIFDQTLGTGFFNPATGGDPILWQHLFWFFGHPEVYVVLLPAMGVVIEIIATFSRKKVFGYRIVIFTVVATGVLSFFVWAHHQFIAGIDPRMANIFTITTLLISVPIAELCFVYIATLYGGSIRLTTPMLWALAFVAEFLIGGVTGIFLGAAGSDIYFHDTGWGDSTGGSPTTRASPSLRATDSRTSGCSRRFRCWSCWPRSSSSSTTATRRGAPVRRPRRTPGRPTRWSGPPSRPHRTATGAPTTCRSSTGALTNSACRIAWTTTGRRTNPPDETPDAPHALAFAFFPQPHTPEVAGAVGRPRVPADPGGVG
ncbi:MAG: cbb3-type cytochrome c oxidase subunit I, partial [Gemmatimonadota bacterium]|nr:cbb3-type cytochrome c oxidase subunit I [Gemmatimonadota bacterium]